VLGCPHSPSFDSSDFRHAKYASFMRQVNGWGFKRIVRSDTLFDREKRHSLAVDCFTVSSPILSLLESCSSRVAITILTITRCLCVIALNSVSR